MFGTLDSRFGVVTIAVALVVVVVAISDGGLGDVIVLSIEV